MANEIDPLGANNLNNCVEPSFIERLLGLTPQPPPPQATPTNDGAATKV